MDTIGQARVDGDARWQRLQAHAFEAPEQGIDFARRLAREQGWTLPQARRAIGLAACRAAIFSRRRALRKAAGSGTESAGCSADGGSWAMC